MKRDDLRLTKPCPRPVATFLYNFGGPHGAPNPDKEPNWRLVWAPDLLEWRGGRRNVWSESVAPSDRGRLVQQSDGSFDTNGLKPVRQEDVLELCPAFTDAPENAKWALQLWFPPHRYGSEESWYQTTKCKKSGLPILGPYPVNGRYEIIAVFMGQEVPGITLLQETIQNHHWQLAQERGSLESRIKQRIADAEADQEAREHREMEEAKARIHDQLTPLFSSSLEAGRWREEMARKAGITEHVGN